MPHINEMKNPSKYLSVPDLQGKNLKDHIKRIAKEAMPNNGEEKWIVYFQDEPKGLALNQTNIKRIAALHGPHTDGWIGKSVTLTTEWTQDKSGNPIEGLRIKMPSRDPRDDDEEMKGEF